MYERFTDRARKAIQLAYQVARRANHDDISTEHVLLGLLDVGGCTATEVLKNLDVDVSKVRAEVERSLLDGSEPRAKKVIEYAMYEARSLNRHYVGTEHILLGLLREQEGVAAQVLVNLGVNLDDARAEIRRIPGEGFEPGEQAAHGPSVWRRLGRLFGARWR